MKLDEDDVLGNLMKELDGSVDDCKQTNIRSTNGIKDEKLQAQ